MPVDFQTLLTVWVAVGVLGALATLGVGYARMRRPAPWASQSVLGRHTPAAATAAQAVPVAPPRADLRRGLLKTRQALLGSIEQLLGGRASLDESTLDEIETLLFGADIGVRTAEDLLAAARAAGSVEAVRPALQARALEILNGAPRASSAESIAGGPRVILVVGVNGSGKTTTIGKLARRYAAEGRSVLVAAADTFRAAAVDQLQVWAERAGAQIVRGAPGGDPAAVAFDAVAAATAQEIDVVLIDTAGRLQTHAGLMDELTKIGRAIRKQHVAAPHEVLLVLDANTGQNAIRQAEEFTRATGVTGIVLAKLDGTAKGGVILGISQELGVPVRYVGIGESIDDLVDFVPEDFVEALFGE